MGVEDTSLLRDRWTFLYTKELPRLAKARDPIQPRWPVTLDHCFARIILDNTVGQGAKQWDHVLSRPAVRNMDTDQLRRAIELAEEIAEGKADLVVLDQISLGVRGKAAGKYGGNQQRQNSGKRKRDVDDHISATAGVDDEEQSKRHNGADQGRKKQATLSFIRMESRPNVTKSLSTAPTTDSMNTVPSKHEPNSDTTSLTEHIVQKPSPSPAPSHASLLNLIQTHPALTPYRKRLYSTLLSVPTGRYTTYAAMATYLSSSARAVGNGMRNNPFAPDVPCHRVLASTGEIGGFGGEWGKDGKHAQKKVDLLRSEGVRFDSRGKVRGPVFMAFREGLDMLGEKGGGGGGMG